MPISLSACDARPKRSLSRAAPHAFRRRPARLPTCRRFQWLFVRIEVELRKIQAQRPEVGVLVPSAPHAYPLHPMDAAAHAHAGDRGADSGSGSEEEGGAPRHSGAAAPRAREKKAAGATRMLPLVDLNPLPR